MNIIHDKRGWEGGGRLWKVVSACRLDNDTDDNKDFDDYDQDRMMKKIIYNIHKYCK